MSIFAPPGESTALGGNPSRTGEANDGRVFGPMGLRWRTYLGEIIGEPLVVDGLVIVAVSRDFSDLDDPSAESLLALRSSDGKKVWERAVERSKAGSLSAAGADGVVVALDAGVASGYALADGAPLWTFDTGLTSNGEDPPIVAGGRTYFAVDDQVYALDAMTGALFWRAAVPLDSDAGIPAIDNGRVFVTNKCGQVVALSRGSGRLAWSQRIPFDGFCEPAGAIVSGGTLFAGDGSTYDAVSGAPLGALPRPPSAAGGGLAFSAGSPARAYDSATGAEVWRSSRIGFARPSIAGPTLFGVTTGARGTFLNGISAATGRPFTRSAAERTGIDDGELAVGAGRIFVVNGLELSAFEPALRPGPDGVDLLPPSSRDYLAGARFRWISGVGSDLRGKRPGVTLERDQFPFGRWSAADRSRTFEDGVAVLKSGLARNTRFRASVNGAKPSESVMLYAYPRIAIEVKAVSRTMGEINVTIGGVDRKSLQGKRAFGYIGSAKKRTFSRLGSGRVKARGKRGTSSIRFRLLDRVGPKDIVGVCVKGLPQEGYGGIVGLTGACGKSRVPYPPGLERSSRIEAGSQAEDSATTGTRPIGDSHVAATDAEAALVAP